MQGKKSIVLKRLPHKQTNSNNPKDSSYVNISTYRVKSRCSTNDQSYVNINTYVDLPNKSAYKKDTTPDSIEINILNDDDSDCNCEEVGNPRINYHILDFRKKKYKKSNRYLTTSVNISQFNQNDHFNAITTAWRRRSFTENKIDSHPKLQSIFYADLVLNNHSVDTADIDNFRKTKHNLEQVEYLEIDYTRTQALKDMDTELMNIRKSKTLKMSYSMKMQSVVTAYHRLLNSMKNVRHNMKKKGEETTNHYISNTS